MRDQANEEEPWVLEGIGDSGQDAAPASGEDEDDLEHGELEDDIGRQQDNNGNNGNHNDYEEDDGSIGDIENSSGPLNNLHDRLMARRRSNILLQALFQRMRNNRRRREEEELAANLPPLPDHPMPVLGHDEAVQSNATCRFCFESSVNDEKNALVAPCNCSGGSRWVHLECLRQWQRKQIRTSTLDDTSTTYTTAGYICNVCNSPYLSRPPSVQAVRRNVLKRGTLLVAKENVGSTFRNTIILLLNEATSGAFGIIVNSPLPESAIPNHLFRNSNCRDQNNNSIEWKRGGPVCGGRLGVVHYTVLHTYPPEMTFGNDYVLDVDIDEEYLDEEPLQSTSAANSMEDNNMRFENDGPDDGSIALPGGPDGDDDEGSVALDETCAPLSLPVFDFARNNPSLHFLASSETHEPVTFAEDNLSRTLPRVVPQPFSRDAENREENLNNIDQDCSQAEATSNSQDSEKVIIFLGYCKWRAGQLQREIQQQLWDVCADATPADILRFQDDSDSVWQEMSGSDRLLSWQQIVEDEEEGQQSAGVQIET